MSNKYVDADESLTQHERVGNRYLDYELRQAWSIDEVERIKYQSKRHFIQFIQGCNK